MRDGRCSPARAPSLIDCPRATRDSAYPGWLRGTGAFRIRSRILSPTLAERPILLGDFDETDHDVLRSDARRNRETLGDSLVEILLPLESARIVCGDLNHDEIIRPVDPKILPT